MSYHGMGYVTATLCVTEAQKSAAVAACKRVQVKGLGDDACALAQLPICAAGEVPLPDLPPPPPPLDKDEDEDGNKTLMVGGIVVLVLAAGSYALYRGAKK
jgi:hypothetical protein